MDARMKRNYNKSSIFLKKSKILFGILTTNYYFWGVVIIKSNCFPKVNLT